MSDNILGSLENVRNVTITITGQVGAGKSTIQKFLIEQIKKTGATVHQTIGEEHTIIVNYTVPCIQM